MGLPKIVYDAGAGNVVLQCLNGPQGFRCFYRARVHDNVATSGVKERVLEARDILISFRMPAMKLDPEVVAWDAFSKFALGGGQFDFYANADIDEHYHCVSEDEAFEPEPVGLQRYAVSFQFRVVPDALAPAGGPAQVLKRFNGIAT